MASPQDSFSPRGILVPCLPFATTVQAEKYIVPLGIDAWMHGLHFLCGEGGGLTFVPDAHRAALAADLLVKPNVGKLAKTHAILKTPLPSKYALLAMERKVTYLTPEPTGSALQRRLLKEPREGVVVWYCHPRVSIPLRPSQSSFDAITRRVATAGYGLMYAREALFNKNGECTGSVLRVLRIHFALGVSHGAAQTPVLRLQFTPDETRGVGDERPPDPQFNGRGSGIWRTLLRRAQKLFKERCKAVPVKTEAWRQLCLEQLSKKKRDRYRPTRDAFVDVVTRLSWREALARVQEPWQLSVVAEEYADSRFDQRPQRGWAPKPTFGRRVNAMINQHICSDEERMRLHRMVDEFLTSWHDDWSAILPSHAMLARRPQKTRAPPPLRIVRHLRTATGRS